MSIIWAKRRAGRWYKLRKLSWCLWLFLLLPMPLYGQKTYELPSQPLDFTPHEPNRPNALDLAASPNGYIFLRYQRATNSQFSFMFDANSYIYWSNLFALATAAQHTSGTLKNDIRVGLGLGLAFWPWEKLHKGYIALRSQLQFQWLQADIQADANMEQFNINRFLVSNSLEIGARLGQRLLSAGAFGGIGLQVPTAASTILPDTFKLPMLYAYVGFSLGFTFS